MTTNKKKIIETVCIPAGELNDTAFEAIIKKASRDGATEVEFMYEPLIGAYLKVNVEEALWEFENFGNKRFYDKYYPYKK